MHFAAARLPVELPPERRKAADTDGGGGRHDGAEEEQQTRWKMKNDQLTESSDTGCRLSRGFERQRQPYADAFRGFLTNN